MGNDPLNKLCVSCGNPKGRFASAGDRALLKRAIALGFVVSNAEHKYIHNDCLKEAQTFVRAHSCVTCGDDAP